MSSLLQIERQRRKIQEHDEHLKRKHEQEVQVWRVNTIALAQLDANVCFRALLLHFVPIETARRAQTSGQDRKNHRHHRLLYVKLGSSMLWSFKLRSISFFVHFVADSYTLEKIYYLFAELFTAFLRNVPISQFYAQAAGQYEHVKAKVRTQVQWVEMLNRKWCLMSI